MPRPFFHKIIIIWYSLTPLLFSFFISLYHHVSLSVVFSDFFFYFGSLAGFIILTAPFVALALNTITRFAWALFFGHNFLILLTSILNFVNFLDVKDFIYMLLLFVYVIILVVTLRPDFRIPYIVDIKRGFRIKKRKVVNYKAMIGGYSATIVDFSESGCKILMNQNDRFDSVFVGSPQQMKITIENKTLTYSGKIVYVANHSLGFQFNKK